MKDWIQEHYGDQNKFSYNTLRKAVREAWDAEQLEELIDSMHDRVRGRYCCRGEGNTTYWAVDILRINYSAFG